MREKFTYET